jgi:hypothetical protein
MLLGFVFPRTRGRRLCADGLTIHRRNSLARFDGGSNVRSRGAIARFVNSSCTVGTHNSEIGAEMNLGSALQSEKELVDVRGFEPLIPCRQSKRKFNLSRCFGCAY